MEQNIKSVLSVVERDCERNFFKLQQQEQFAEKLNLKAEQEIQNAVNLSAHPFLIKRDVGSEARTQESTSLQCLSAKVFTSNS